MSAKFQMLSSSASPVETQAEQAAGNRMWHIGELQAQILDLLVVEETELLLKQTITDRKAPFCCSSSLILVSHWTSEQYNAALFRGLLRDRPHPHRSIDWTIHFKVVDLDFSHAVKFFVTDQHTPTLDVAFEREPVLEFTKSFVSGCGTEPLTSSILAAIETWRHAMREIEHLWIEYTCVAFDMSPRPDGDLAAAVEYVTDSLALPMSTPTFPNPREDFIEYEKQRCNVAAEIGTALSILVIEDERERNKSSKIRVGSGHVLTTVELGNSWDR